jgi:hypothetical protein
MTPTLLYLHAETILRRVGGHTPARSSQNQRPSGRKKTHIQEEKNTYTRIESAQSIQDTEMPQYDA